MGNVVSALAENWVVGYSVFCSVVIIGYIVFSTLLVLRCRKYNYDVGVGAMIPLYNVVIFFKSIKYKKHFIKNGFSNESDEYIIPLEEEFDL